MSTQPPSRYSVTRSELEALLDDWGEPRYRATQTWDALYRSARRLEDATELPRVLRDRLVAALPLSLEPMRAAVSSDGTMKWLWSCVRDSAQIETVLMAEERRAAVLVTPTRTYGTG